MLEAQGLSKAYGGIQALNACSISVEQAKIAGLIGPNGSGKTTLFDVITGYEHADRGQVRFNGARITNAPPDTVFGLGIGRTFQITRVFPRLTVMENMHVASPRRGGLGLFRRSSSPQEQRRALDLLEFVGIAHLKSMPAENLSYGQKKLLEFACVLVAEPHMILLDEPAGGVNPTMITRLAEHIRLAQLFASWVDANPDFERLAPVPFSVVCFRWNPIGTAGEKRAESDLDVANERLLDLVNESGEVFLSHTRVREGTALRLAVGHSETAERHVKRAWDLLVDRAATLR